jgi:MYXO-CTERM domain-containing protein
MRWIAIAMAVSAAAGSARADAIGAPPVREDCARGSMSVVVAPRSHRQLAYCAPALCEETEACERGRRCATVELEIVERTVPGSSGRGGPPPEEAPPVARYAEVAGTCDASDDEVPIAMRHGESIMVFFGGPTIDRVPVGCHRVRAWVADASCTGSGSEPGSEPGSSAEPRSGSGAGSASGTAAATGTEAAPATEAGGSCACRMGGGDRSRALLLLVLVLVLVRVRRPRAG